MVSESIRRASRLRRRSRIPPDQRTPKRKEVADWIEEHAADSWADWRSTDVAEEVGYSRQHVNNVLEHYFVPVEEEDVFAEIADQLGVTDTAHREQILGELTSRELLIYRLGYRDAMQDTRTNE